MTNTQETPTGSTFSAVTVSGSGTTVGRGGWRKLLFVIGLLLVIASVTVGAVVWQRTVAAKNRAKAAAIAAAQLKTLQTELTYDLSTQNDQAIVNDTNLIFTGVQANKFHVSDHTLAQYYLAAGASQLNLKQSTSALSDFQKADKLDLTVHNAALQGEVSAGYALGERQQLIPQLQQLEALAKQNQSMDPLDTTPGQYQADIDAIEHNQPAEL